MTTNCIMKPLPSYVDRIYSTGEVGYDNVKHIQNDYWDELIQAAIKCEGFRDENHC